MAEFCPFTYKGYPEGYRYPWTFPMPSEKERDRRWRAVRKSMASHHLECLIVGAGNGYMPISSSGQLYYISNFMPFVNSGTYALFPIDREPRMAVSTSVGPQYVHCAHEVSWIRQVTGSLNPIEDVIKTLKELDLQDSRWALPATARRVPRLRIRGPPRGPAAAKLADATSAIGEAMDEVSRTSEEELALLNKSCEIMDLSFDAVAAALKPGVRECDLWAAAEYAIVSNGGWYPHFMLATSGPNPLSCGRRPRKTSSPPETWSCSRSASPTEAYTPRSAMPWPRPPEKDVEQMFDFCGSCMTTRSSSWKEPQLPLH